MEAGAKAMDEAVQFAWDIGVRDVICLGYWSERCYFQKWFEACYDSLTVALLQPVAIANIITAICHKQKDFRSVELSHVRQRGNKLAHILAQHAKCLHIFLTWIEENLILIESVRCIVFILFLIKLLYFPLKKKKKN